MYSETVTKQVSTRPIQLCTENQGFRVSRKCKLQFHRSPALTKVLIFKSRGGLSLIVQPTIQCAFLAYFDPENYTLHYKFTVYTFLCQSTF